MVAEYSRWVPPPCGRYYVRGQRAHNGSLMLMLNVLDSLNIKQGQIWLRSCSCICTCSHFRLIPNSKATLLYMPPEANQIFLSHDGEPLHAALGGVLSAQHRRQTPESLVIKCDGWQEQVLSKPRVLPNEVLPSRILNWGCQTQEHLDLLLWLQTFSERGQERVYCCQCVYV